VNLGDLRVGSGFDTHTFSADPARPLVLGGVTFAGARGLVGHSDADVIAHACAEALLGAAGMGDIGTWFPDDDPSYGGADSVSLLRTVADELRRAGWTAINIDCSVVCEAHDDECLAQTLDRFERGLDETLSELSREQSRCIS